MSSRGVDTRTLGDQIDRLGNLGDKGVEVAAAARTVKEDQLKLMRAVASAQEVLTGMQQQITERNRLYEGDITALQRTVDALQEKADDAEADQLRRLSEILTTLQGDPDSNKIEEAIQGLDRVMGGRLAREARVTALAQEDNQLPAFGEPRLRNPATTRVRANNAVEERDSGSAEDISTTVVQRGDRRQAPGTSLRQRRGRGAPPDETTADTDNPGGLFANLGRALGIGADDTKKNQGGGSRKRKHHHKATRRHRRHKQRTSKNYHKKHRGGGTTGKNIGLSPTASPNKINQLVKLDHVKSNQTGGFTYSSSKTSSKTKKESSQRRATRSKRRRKRRGHKNKK